jgi:hypothetical protein
MGPVPMMSLRSSGQARSIFCALFRPGFKSEPDQSVYARVCAHDPNQEMVDLGLARIRSRRR